MQVGLLMIRAAQGTGGAGWPPRARCCRSGRAAVPAGGVGPLRSIAGDKTHRRSHPAGDRTPIFLSTSRAESRVCNATFELFHQQCPRAEWRTC